MTPGTRIVVTGAAGQLGSTIVAHLARDFDVVAFTRAQLDIADQAAVSDTIGVAHPGQVRQVLDAVLTRGTPASRIALHFHDTRGTALANVLAALDFGITTFDASAGGLGGCPYAPGAAGNLATEDLVYMLHGLGHATGVDLDAVVHASPMPQTRAQLLETIGK